jgi:hypothetical protein
MGRVWGLTTLAVCLLCAGTASASGTAWYYNDAQIPAAQTVEVPTSGPRTTVNLKPEGQPKVALVCAVTGREAFWNTEERGHAETRALSFACPEGLIVRPLVPWGSSLLEGEPPLHDEWEGVAVEVTYAGTDYGVFTGSINTTVGDVEGEKEREGKLQDEPDNYLTFRGGVDRPSLVNAHGAKLWLAGHYHLGVKGARITDESGAL